MTHEYQLGSGFFRNMPLPGFPDISKLTCWYLIVHEMEISKHIIEGMLFKLLKTAIIISFVR